MRTHSWIAFGLIMMIAIMMVVPTSRRVLAPIGLVLGVIGVFAYAFVFLARLEK